MKGHLILFTAVALVASACVKDVEILEPEGRQTVIRAFHEGYDMTRTTVRDGGTQIYWEPSDAIELFFKDLNPTLLYSQNTEDATVTTFSGGLSSFMDRVYKEISSNDLLWGLYPYKDHANFSGESVTTYLPSDQNGKAGSFAKNTHITVAKSDDLNLVFYNVCGGLRFSLTHEGIKRVVFEGNDGEAIAGRIKIAFDGEIPIVQEVIESKTKIQLTAPNGGSFQTGQWYYIEAIPGSLKNGFKLTFYKDSECAEYISRHSVTIKRSVYGSLGEMDKDLEFNSFSPPEYPIPEAIDLGLGVKWASFNLGASKPEDVGFYFAWGETEPKEFYDWSTYKWCNGDFNTLTKYNIYKSYGAIDDKKGLDLDDDAAHINLGGNWLMPIKEDLDELAKNCLVEEATVNGILGYKVTSKKEGYTDKSIFFPAAGFRREDSLIYRGSRCEYWCSSQYGGYGTLASLSFRADCFSNPTGVNGRNRYYGHSIRPILISIPINEIQLSQTSLTLWPGNTRKLSPTVLPSNSSRKTLVWKSSDNSIATVDNDGVISAYKIGSVIITATAYDGSGVSASCDITVTEPPVPEAVDLGLSVKWASFNLGAGYAGGRGTNYAWGEIDPKSSYTWSNYKWCRGSEITLTKYNTNGSSGIIDNQLTLDLDDDAAHVHLGGSWRIPTMAEFQELWDNCTISSSSSGLRFRGKKEGYTDNSILIPYTTGNPIINYSGTNQPESYLFYWTSTLNNSNTSSAFTAVSGRNYYSDWFFYRYYGLPIRPVCDK